jgi:hypothetical protein
VAGNNERETEKLVPREFKTLDYRRPRRLTLIGSRKGIQSQRYGSGQKTNATVSEYWGCSCTRGIEIDAVIL